LARVLGTTLRGRLLLIVVVTFIPLLALEAYLLDAQAGTLRERILGERHALARSEAQVAATFIEGNIRTLQALSVTPAIRDPGSGNLDALLRSITQRDPAWLTVALSGPDGFNISSLTTPARTVNISDRDYFQGALAGRPTVGTAILTRSTGAKSLVIAVPVDAANGTRTVLSGALSLTTTETELRRSLPAGIELVVVDRKGQQFIGPGIGETFPVLTGRPEVDAALRGEDGARVVQGEGNGAVVAYAASALAGWGVILREPAAIAFAEIDRDRMVALGLTALATAIALLLALVLGSRLERTYAAMAVAREEVERGRLDVTHERDRLQRVVDEMPVAVAIYDRTGRAVVRNETYRKLLGGDPPALIGDTLSYYRSRTPDGHALGLPEHPTTRALRGESVRGEEVIIDYAGTGPELHILVNALPFRHDEQIEGALVVFQDITALKAVERERAAFFDMASHEIKTPLTSLLGHVQLALRRAREGRFERLEEVLTRAEQGGRRLGELVRDLLDVSRLDEGGLILRRERLELGALVTTVVEEIGPAASDHQIVVDRSGELLWVEAEAARLIQVIHNLVDNAVRYSPSGGRIDVRLRREGDEAVVRVADQGLGIPEEERPMLFRRFFRSSRTQIYGGTGLGLFISRRIAEMHGGRLELERSGPDGSVFVFAMPIAADEGRAAGPDDERPSERAAAPS
jgi:PAS domain S-box-containing protein